MQLLPDDATEFDRRELLDDLAELLEIGYAVTFKESLHGAPCLVTFDPKKEGVRFMHKADTAACALSFVVDKEREFRKRPSKDEEARAAITEASRAPGPPSTDGTCTVCDGKTGLHVVQTLRTVTRWLPGTPAPLETCDKIEPTDKPRLVCGDCGQEYAADFEES